MNRRALLTGLFGSAVAPLADRVAPIDAAVAPATDLVAYNIGTRGAPHWVFAVAVGSVEYLELSRDAFDGLEFVLP